MAIHAPLHPGEIVREILFNDESPFNDMMSAANALCIHRVTLSRLLNGHSALTPEMAGRLSLLTGTSIEMWLGLQLDYDVAIAKKLAKHLKVKKAA